MKKLDLENIKTRKDLERWLYDLTRKQTIISLTNCKFIEIWENDWNKNKELCIQYIKSQL